VCVQSILKCPSMKSRDIRRKTLSVFTEIKRLLLINSNWFWYTDWAKQNRKVFWGNARRKGCKKSTFNRSKQVAWPEYLHSSSAVHPRPHLLPHCNCIVFAWLAHCQDLKARSGTTVCNKHSDWDATEWGAAKNRYTGFGGPWSHG
jgi:hypothetical protein